ncbi:pyruvate, phosphate dikinase [Petrimonas sp. IBARAKI]|nr:pyruvate, phosphate dikinase [Petrimonas sp. IBARAKI]
MKKKRVYTFGNGQAEGRADMKNLLGGKGANLAEMNLIGVPVPRDLPLPPKCVPNTTSLAKIMW